MADWDFYCALCAAPFHTSGIEEITKKQNNENFSNFLFSWAGSLQAVGENSQSNGLSCCYISGEGYGDFYGGAICKTSEDPNCPSADLGSETFIVTTYFNYADMQEGVIPVHSACLHIFKKVLAREKGAVEVNPDTLLGALREKRNTQSLRCLDINYYELDKGKNEKFFLDCLDTRLLPFLLDPLVIPAMEDYVERIPLLSDTTTFDPNPPSRTHLFTDPFCVLPPEILAEILLTFPVSPFSHFMSASPAARRLELPQSFWQKRTAIHIPWSWEVFARVSQTEARYNWRQIYHDLEGFSIPDQTIGKSLPLGFANRRRIYHVCEELVRSYVHLEAEAHSASLTGDVAQMLESAKCLHFPAVSMPFVPELNSITKFMIPRWSDIALEQKTIEISWNSSGVLAGIAITIKGIRSAVESRANRESLPSSTDTLILQGCDWIDGFEFHMSARAPKVVGVKIRTLCSPAVTFGSTGPGVRLMVVEPGNVFVGLKGVTTQDCITRLGILECPCPGHIELPLPARTVDVATKRLIWKHTMPPANVHATPFYTGYNSYGREATENGQIMEALIFGTSEAQLRALTGVAVSADFLGFFVYYNNTEPSSIGVTKTNLKHFPIDGPGGERIVQVTLACGARPAGLKILTNQGRQGIFGMHRRDSCDIVHTFPPSSSHDDGVGVAGIYGSFETVRGRPRYTAFGVLSYIIPNQTHTIIPEAPDAWDPTPPPSHWHAEGPIYGSNDYFALTHLDLTKPVSNISGLLAAPSWTGITELGGFVVTYIDGSVSYIGTPTDLWSSVDDIKSAESIRRHQYVSKGYRRSEEEEVVAHVTTEEAVAQNRFGGSNCWDLGPEGEVISKVTVWSTNLLNGVQFHLADGRSSARWGKCGQEPSAVILSGFSAQAEVEAVRMTGSNVPVYVGAIGVKFFLDSRRGFDNASSARPIGLQVLVADLDG
ncbi:hypothetical protein D9757_005050 [Collybiopsis confluens]|uniref:F-box domain-containing protein n=1 Tax=Collybiopsis confluens TaxID=2823264 RepID=A0A8H5HTG3_9AGAR|nr:hypothetical protein D9757_005050 [Collybiopsis confluens]